MVNGDLLHDIDLELEAFTADLVPAILGDDGGFFITYSYTPNSLCLEWEWERLDSRKRRKSFETDEEESSEMLKNRIKAYLFDLCVLLS